MITYLLFGMPVLSGIRGYQPRISWLLAGSLDAFLVCLSAGLHKCLQGMDDLFSSERLKEEASISQLSRATCPVFCSLEMGC